MRLQTLATALFPLVIAACAPQGLAVAELPPVIDSPVPGDLQPGQRQAFFTSYPQTLLTAARAACSSPGQTPTEPAPGTVRCETLPTPDIAAALILGYGGTVEALPLYIVSFVSQSKDGGYIVTADSYVVVPQIDGSLREVRLADKSVEDGMTDLLVAAGGQPL